MKQFFAFSLSAVLIISCNKNSEINGFEAKETCIKGKVVAKGCYGNMIIQIVSPRPEFLRNSVYSIGNNQPMLDYVITTNLPLSIDQQVGDLFYFTAKHFAEVGVTTQECVWPKYGAEIQNISENSCD